MHQYIVTRNVFRDCLKLFLPITGFRKLPGREFRTTQKAHRPESVAQYNQDLSGGGSEIFPRCDTCDWRPVVCQSRGLTDARPLLHSLHWLPLRQWVTYKLALLTHKVQTTATPMYLSELVQTHAPPRALHSSDAPLLVVPRTHIKLSRRTFSVAASSTWNSLHANVRLCENILTFKRHSKTHLFKLT